MLGSTITINLNLLSLMHSLSKENNHIVKKFPSYKHSLFHFLIIYHIQKLEQIIFHFCLTSMVSIKDNIKKLNSLKQYPNNLCEYQLFFLMPQFQLNQYSIIPKNVSKQTLVLAQSSSNRDYLNFRYIEELYYDLCQSYLLVVLLFDMYDLPHNIQLKDPIIPLISSDKLLKVPITKNIQNFNKVVYWQGNKFLLDLILVSQIYCSMVMCFLRILLDIFQTILMWKSIYIMLLNLFVFFAYVQLETGKQLVLFYSCMQAFNKIS